MTRANGLPAVGLLGLLALTACGSTTSGRPAGPSSAHSFHAVTSIVVPAGADSRQEVAALVRLATDTSVLQELRSELNLDLSVTELNPKLVADASDTTHVRITAVDTDARRAASLANGDARVVVRLGQLQLHDAGIEVGRLANIPTN